MLRRGQVVTVDALLSSLSELGIVPVLTADGPKLTGATSKLTPELRAELGRSRDAIVAALSKPVRRIMNLDTGEVLEEWGAPNLSHVARVKAWKEKLPEARLGVHHRGESGWVEFLILNVLEKA
jgi:hypothetical protein